MDNTITVSYKGRLMIISQAVADNFGIKQGYRIKSEAEFWDILNANSSHNIAVLNTKIEENKGNLSN